MAYALSWKVLGVPGVPGVPETPEPSDVSADNGTGDGTEEDEGEGEDDGEGVSAKCGPRSAPPARWVTRTAMTPGAGAVHVTVTDGPFSRSPRCRIGWVGACTSRASGDVMTSRTSTG